MNHLLKIAAALDVGLLVKFVPFSRLVKEFEDLSPEAMSSPSFIEELPVLEAWVDEGDSRFKESISVSASRQLDNGLDQDADTLKDTRLSSEATGTPQLSIVPQYILPFLTLPESKPESNL